MKRLVLIGLAMLLIGSLSASAGTVVTYVSGPMGVTGQNTTTTGTQVAPWTITESYTGTGAAVIQLSNPTGGSALDPGNSTGTVHEYGKWFEKTVTNNTLDIWTSFELELQVILGTASLDGDGLSFAQGGGLLFSSDKFPVYTAIEDIRDYLNFHGGTVAPGESVTFLFAVTDVERSSFYLAETPNKPEVSVPEPATLFLLGSGALLGLLRRRRA